MSRTHRILIGLLALLALVAVSCGSDDDDDGGTTTSAGTGDTSAPDTTVAPETTAAAETTAAPDTTAAPETTAATETTAGDEAAVGPDVQITGVDLTTGTVTLTNTTDADIEIGGHWLCNRPVYVEVPAESLAAGASTDIVLGDFDAAGGEAALYTSNSFDDSGAIVDYVHWGSGGGRVDVAVEATVWTGDPIPADAVGDQLAQSEPGSAAGWS
ncbi:MAG: hypothetical protein ACR2QE_02970 [Acidimicrobiales bacterium]